MEGEEEGARVLGLGVGLFILILLWFCTAAGLLLFSRLDSPQGLVYVVLASIVTAVLLAIPRTDYKKAKESEDDVVKVLDQMFIWRTILLVLLAVSILVVGGITLVQYALHSIQPASIKTFRNR